MKLSVKNTLEWHSNKLLQYIEVTFVENTTIWASRIIKTKVEGESTSLGLKAFTTNWLILIYSASLCHQCTK